MLCVTGCSRVPEPPARMMPFTFRDALFPLWVPLYAPKRYAVRHGAGVRYFAVDVMSADYNPSMKSKPSIGNRGRVEQSIALRVRVDVASPDR